MKLSSEALELIRPPSKLERAREFDGDVFMCWSYSCRLRRHAFARRSPGGEGIKGGCSTCDSLQCPFSTRRPEADLHPEAEGLLADRASQAGSTGARAARSGLCVRWCHVYFVYTCVWKMYCITHPQVPDTYEVEEPFLCVPSMLGHFDVSSLRLGTRFVPRASCAVCFAIYISPLTNLGP